MFKRGLRLGGEGVSFFATQSLPKEYLKAVSISVCYTEAFEKIPMSQREWSSGKNITPFFCCCCCSVLLLLGINVPLSNPRLQIVAIMTTAK